MTCTIVIKTVAPIHCTETDACPTNSEGSSIQGIIASFSNGADAAANSPTTADPTASAAAAATTAAAAAASHDTSAATASAEPDTVA